MTTLQIFFIALVAFLHIYFLILEMFLWTTPKGIKAFGLKSKEFAEETKVLTAIDAIRWGLLAAGLIWALLWGNVSVASFFFTCVIVAGIYGAYSTKKIKLFYIQAVPAIIGLVLLHL